MFIFNVLPLREFCSPKSQFAKCQCLCIISVLSCIINVFSPEKGGKPYGKVSLLSDFWPSAENSRKLERINQISHSLPTAPTNYVKFTESAPMASNLEVNPVNPRKIQQTMQIPHHSHNTSGKSREIRDICKQQTRYKWRPVKDTSTKHEVVSSSTTEF